MKIVHSPSQHHQKRFVQEIAMLRACYDSNIVSFLGASVREGRLEDLQAGTRPARHIAVEAGCAGCISLCYHDEVSNLAQHMHAAGASDM